jgi:hypothetical protein
MSGLDGESHPVRLTRPPRYARRRHTGGAVGLERANCFTPKANDRIGANSAADSYGGSWPTDFNCLPESRLCRLAAGKIAKVRRKL